MRKFLLSFLTLSVLACSNTQEQSPSDETRSPDSDSTSGEVVAAAAPVNQPVLPASSPALQSAYKSLLATKMIPEDALASSFRFYEANKQKAKLCDNYIGIADYTKSEKQPRFVIANIKTGQIEDVLNVSNSKAMASGGALNNCGSGSGRVPCGFLKMGPVYKNPQYGLAMRISGLEFKNANASSRALIAIGSPAQPHTPDGKWVREQYKKALDKGINSPDFAKFVQEFEKGFVSGIENGKPVTKKFTPGINGQISYGGPTFDIAGMMKARKLQGCMFMNYFGGRNGGGLISEPKGGLKAGGK